MGSIKRVLTRAVLALVLLVPIGAGVSPAAANDGVSPGYYWCYELDNHVHTHTEWNGSQGWRTLTYHHYSECTDGTWYWSTFRYEWYQSYWVWVG